MPSSFRLQIQRLPGRVAVCCLPADAPLPVWVAGAALGALLCVTRTDEELSIIAGESDVPHDVIAERGFMALRVVGQLDFSLVGVLASLTGALAESAIPVLALSTYRTDILLVREVDAERALAALAEVADVLPDMT